MRIHGESVGERSADELVLNLEREMTEEEKEKIRTLIEERKRFVNEIVRQNDETLKAIETAIENDDDSSPYLDSLRVFPMTQITKKDEYAMKMAVDFLFYEFCSSYFPYEKEAREKEESARDALERNGYGDMEIIILENESYDSALVGVSEDGRAIYSYEKMIEWYMRKNNCSDTDAMEWIDYNTIRALPYAGAKAPIIMYDLDREE